MRSHYFPAHHFFDFSCYDYARYGTGWEWETISPTRLIPNCKTHTQNKDLKELYLQRNIPKKQRREEGKHNSKTNYKFKNEKEDNSENRSATIQSTGAARAGAGDRQQLS